MIRTGLVVTAIVWAVAAQAQVPVQRVADDGRTVDRVIEVGRDRVPVDLLQKIATQDLDLLRGRRADDTYEFAHYDRLEASRVSDSFSVEPTGADKLTRMELRGEAVYRVIIDIPNRRMLVTKNHPLWIDHVEAEYVGERSDAPRSQTIKIGASLAPGTSRTIDLEQIARQATIRVFARADQGSGYANIAITLLQAKVFDNPDSPYAAAVSSVKSLQHALDAHDMGGARNAAQHLSADLGQARPAVRTVEVIAPPDAVTPRNDLEPPSADTMRDLSQIEDLLTGNDAERREGLDRLHQLIRRMRGR